MDPRPPVPPHVSAELQKHIAVPVPVPPPIPTSVEGWKAWQREADGTVSKVASEVARKLEVKIEPVDVVGVTCHRVTPARIAASKADTLIVHVHGGAFAFNAGMAGTSEAILLAHVCQQPVLSVDYRMPPDYPFPAGSDDVLAVWKKLLQTHSPNCLVMGGTSAGAGLTLTTMLRCKSENLPLPAALFLGTPYADATKAGDSLFFEC